MPRDKAYTGLNYLIQGAAATIMKIGLINAAEAIRHIEGAHLVLPVHDELVTQCHSNDAEQVQALIVDAMCAATDKLELVCSSSICHNNYSEGK